MFQLIVSTWKAGILASFSSVQSLSHVRLFATPWIAACQASLSITNSQSLLKLMPIESVMPSSHLVLCHPLLLLPPIPPSIRVFSNESTLRTRWPKYWSFRFSISPSNEHPGLISFRMEWLDLLAVQGTLKSLLQHHSSNASIFQHSGLFRKVKSSGSVDWCSSPSTTSGSWFLALPYQWALDLKFAQIYHFWLFPSQMPSAHCHWSLYWGCLFL